MHKEFGPFWGWVNSQSKRFGIRLLLRVKDEMEKQDEEQEIEKPVIDTTVTKRALKY